MAILGILTVATILRLGLTHHGGTSAAAASGESRPLEARLSGRFSWVPSRPGRGATSHLRSEIASTLVSVRGLSTPSARHAAGVAQLLSGKQQEALSALSAAAESSNDSRVWSDLAAAAYTAAVDDDDLERLADALGAADAALAIDPQLPEALFNRALILQRLGLRDDARSAWNRYLLHDSDEEWLTEGRRHFGGVAPLTPFKDLLSRNYQHLLDDPTAVRDLADRWRERARIEGGIEILGRWAEAEIHGDRASAEKHLRLARELGSELQRVNGDRMLARAVAVIDASTETSRAELASAHFDYRNGVRTFWDNRPTEAQLVLQRAAEEFQRAGSPLALMARYYAANTIFDQGRREEARGILEAVLTESNADFPACRAHVLSQIGACHFARTAWGDAMRAFQASAELFERLGETSNAAAVHRVMSIVYDQNDDRRRAWQQRLVALRGLGGESNLRLEKIVSAIAQEAVLRKNWRTAAAFLAVEAALARRIGDDVHLAETLLFHAAVQHRLRDSGGAMAEIAEAETVAARVQDAAYRAHLRANGLAVRSMIAEPSEAIQLLTEAIAFEGTRGDRKDIPRLLLQRARARRAADPAGAAADLDRGIAELETERGTLPAGEARWGAFHSAEELFDDAIDLAIDGGDTAKAFAVAERARARSLLEALAQPRELDCRLLPPGTTLVEYAALPSRLVIFTADRSGLQAATIPINRAQLAEAADAFVAALESDGDAKRAAAALRIALLDPVAARVADATTIVFVPDATVAHVPFAALIDRQGQFLVERHAVVVAPSARVFATGEAPRGELLPPRSVLVVANARGGKNLGTLGYVTAEAHAVARAYASWVLLQDDAAQYDELMRRGPSADIIHFGGHAIGDDSGVEPASIVLRQGGEERRIGVAAIAALPLRHTSVVVLAGCNTARGERRGTEGVISAARGFLAAGARSVVATLWSIDDAGAAEIFPRLHGRLAEGVSAAEALREVQLESIRRGNVPTSVWAALQVMGN